ncbi:hypothetical protein A3J90_04670 [candidate division WOR-1 bacterium RIFOXYC2_FULL_37_10]|uniref:Uncharacterized protein n=1 Tax=candidate division WOR-1 bacterium RIFOXYB2_FULL_37_13 TaxID=1802579 RepID=A0A1F4SLW4_UNCSA|nr:MAG: hypothetical protein A2246_06785 [candidate division WOR-1 bacterium RIFOXYA2_FULL_37_7]OGC21399.1 MAG: hypothetical protein A2310_01370 [candidate division WOR-1 bacterium RIFOXYB2_FULL_37_13]OGC33463.1 MAG: hypothetical protein A3J90_04670 [candidate division WOR-1 bacterium RIFOXYC2_FULL_37_10]
MFDCLYIRELENGEIAVGGDLKESFEQVFPAKKIDEAIDFFIQKRKKLRLGLDFEIDNRKPSFAHL